MGLLKLPERKNMSEEEKKKPKYSFKENIIGLDLLASMEGEAKEALKTSINLAARATENPKLSNKDVLMMPLKEFQLFLKEFQEHYNLKEDFLG